MSSKVEFLERSYSSVSTDNELLPSGYLPIPATGPVTAQHISDFDHERRIAREKITIYSQPRKTLYLLIEGAVVLVKYFLYMAITHPIVIYLLMPAMVIWLIIDRLEPHDKNRPYRIILDKIEFYVEFGVWWIGILSSIGLGSGLQSGVLFMFPHIFRVCLAAQSCKSIHFESDSNMWFRQPPNLFKCPESSVSNLSTLSNLVITQNRGNSVTFFDMWSKVIIVCFLQAAGTAIGEIPPYWMTRAARLAALESGSSGTNDDPDAMPEELETNSEYSMDGRFFTKHGFYGVLFMASFPNLAFDLCGICCGHYLMPFWTFFWATFLGKAIIRNSYQSIIYVALCSEQYMELLIKILQYLAPDSLHIDHTIRQLLEEGRKSFQRLSNGEIDPSKPSPIISSQSTSNLSYFIPNFKFKSVGEAFSFWWQTVFMRSILLLFLLSCITQFAQYYQLLIDREESNKLRSRLPAKLRETITSPVSGPTSITSTLNS